MEGALSKDIDSTDNTKYWQIYSLGCSYIADRNGK